MHAPCALIVAPSGLRRAERRQPAPHALDDTETQVRLACSCGTILMDQTDNLPNKAHVRPDELDHTYADAIAADAEQIARRHRAAPAAKAEDLLKDDLEMLGMSGVQYERSPYERDQCGRLYIALAGADAFAVYVPETTFRGVLAALHHVDGSAPSNRSDDG